MIDFSEQLKVTVAFDPDLAFRQRLCESIKSRDVRSVTSHPKFNTLRVKFQETLNLESENCPPKSFSTVCVNDISPLVLQNLHSILHKIWSCIDGLPNFLRRSAEQYFSAIFSPVSQIWLNFVLAHKQLSTSSKKQYNMTLNSFSYKNFDISGQQLVDSLLSRKIAIWQFYQALYNDFVFNNRSKSHVTQVSSALAYKFSLLGKTVHSLDPYWTVRTNEIKKSERTQVSRHGRTLTLHVLTQVSQSWLATGASLDLWRVAVLWTCYFLALRASDLFSCERSWFAVDFSDIWIKSKTQTTKTGIGRYDCYLPKIRGGLWDCEFWFQILDKYRDPASIYLFVVPGKLKQGRVKFTNHRFNRYFLTPFNDKLEKLGLFQSEKRFTVHSFRYSLSSSFCDELELPDTIAACALKHTQYKKGQYSSTGKIYQLSGAECLSLQKALQKFAKADSGLGKIFSSFLIHPSNRTKYERFLNWKTKFVTPICKRNNQLRLLRT